MENVLLRILLVEDHQSDAELTERELKANGIVCEIRRVELREDFEKALAEFNPDLIISDYSLPLFTGREALAIALDKTPSTPVIMLTGSMNEQTAVECMKSGAWDYVIKEHIKRLPFAVREALDKKTIIEKKEKAEKALADSENRFRSLLDTVENVAVQSYTPDGTVCYWNKASERLYGYTSEEAIGKNLVDIIVPPEMRDEVTEAIGNMMKTGETYPPEEFSLVHKNGSRVPVHTSFAIIDVPGKGRELFCIDIDLSDRKKAEDELRFERNMLRALLETTPDMMWFRDREGRNIVTSKSHADHLGKKTEDLIGKTDLDFYPREIAELWLGDDDRVMETKKPRIGIDEQILCPATGKYRWVSTTKMPWYDDAGRVIGTFGITRDISDLKNVESELAQERDLLRYIMDVLPLAVYCKDKDGRWVHASKGFYSDYRKYAKRMGAKPRKSVIGLTDLEIFPEGHGEGAYEDDTRVLTKGESIINKVEYIVSPDGHEQYILTTKVPRYDEKGNIIGLVGTSQNINELKQLEKDLASERDLFKYMTDVLPISFYIKDHEGRFIHTSQGYFTEYKHYCGLFGIRPKKNLIGKSDKEIFPKEQGEKMHADDMHVIQTGQSIIQKVEHLITPKGDDHYVLTTKVPRLDESGKIIGLIGTSQRITELKKLEKEVADERDLLRSLMDTLPASVYTKDRDGRLILVSAGFYSGYREYCEKFGLEYNSEVIGKTDRDLFLPEHAERMIEDEKKILKSGKPVIRKLEELTVSDGIATYTLTTKAPRLDKDGKIVGIIGMSENITEMKMLEKQVENERDRLRKLMDTLPAAVYLKDREGHLLHVSGGYYTQYRQYCEKFGLAYSDTIIGKTDAELFNKEHASGMVTDDKKVMERGDSLIRNLEHFVDKAGKELHILSTKVPYYGTDGKIIGLIGVSEDISELKNLEKEIAHERDLLRNLMNSLPFSIFVKDTEGRLQWVSRHYLKQEGAPADILVTDIIGKTDFDLYPEKLAREAAEDERFVMESKQPIINKEEYSTAADGSEIILHVIKAPMFDSHGNVIGIVGASTNITEQKKIAERMQLQSAALEASANAIVITDRSGMILYVNPAFVRLTGFTEDESVGKNPKELVKSGEHDAEFYRDMWETILSGQVWHGEILNKKKDGSRYYEEQTIAPVHDADGYINYFIAIKQNITERKQIEEALRKSEEKYREIINGMRDTAWILDNDGKFIDVNDAAVEVMGYTKEELLTMGPWNIDESVEQEQIVDMVRQMLIDKVQTFETLHTTKAGKRIPVEINSSLVTYGGKQAILSVARDITDRKTAGEALREREKQLSAIADNIPGPAARVDKELRYLFVNKWYEKMFDMPAEKILGRRMPEVLPEPLFNDILKSHIQKVLSGEKVIFESTTGNDKGTFYFEVIYTPDILPDGRVNGFFITGIDITARRRSQEFQEAENQVLTLLGKGTDLNEILDSIARLGEKYNPAIKTSIMLANEEKSRLFYASAPSLPKTYIAALEHGLPVGPDIGSCGTSAYLKKRVIVADISNDERWNSEAAKHTISYGLRACWSEPIIASDGSILGTVANYSAVAGEPDADNLRVMEWSARIAGFAIERRKAEEAIQESEARFRTIYENTSLGLYRTTPEGRVLLANPALINMIGYNSFKEIEYLNIETNGYLDVSMRDEFKRLMEERDELTGYEAEWMRKDGTRIFVRESAKAVRDQTGEIIYYDGTVEDITERKIAEIALRQSEEQYRKFFEDDISADFISSTDGSILACNPAYLQMFGFDSYEEAYQKNIWDLFSALDDRAAILSVIGGGESLDAYELNMRRIDGALIHIIANISGIYDERGRLIQLKGYLIDDTNRKRLESQLLQAQKLESIGQLAGGVAHDLNNVLGAIMGYADLGKRKVSEQHPLYNRLEKILDLTVRGARITEQLLAFSRRQVIEPKKINLNILIADLLKLLGKTLGEHVTINFNETPDLNTVFVDPGQMDQVLMNLCINARDAMPSGGVLNISTRNVNIDEEYAQYHVDAKPGEYVLMTISDSGVGIPPDVIERIFDPFFTTKEVGKGTGLGLSVVHGIVGQHNGFINVYSEIDLGTTFSIYLPSVKQAPDEDSLTERKEVPKGTGTILVVEDDKDILSMINILLENQGYTVISALHGEEGIGIFKEKERQIDMVITDVVMPGMSGRKLYETLRDIKPDLRCLFISGYTADIMPVNFTLEEGAHFIAKPFSPADFNQKVYDILNEEKP